MSRFESHAKAEPTAEEFQTRDEEEARRQEARFQRERNAIPTVELQPVIQPIRPPGRPLGPPRQAEPPDPDAGALTQAAAIATDPAHRKQPKSEPDEQLTRDLSRLLASYTLGTLLDAAWATDRALSRARHQARNHEAA